MVWHKHFPSFRSLAAVLFISFLGIIFGVLAKFSFGRSLLLNYPKVFSLGFVSHEGPSEEAMKKSRFSITFFGQGWDEKLAEPTDQHTTLPSKKIVTRVSASNPGNCFSFFNFCFSKNIQEINTYIINILILIEVLCHIIFNVCEIFFLQIFVERKLIRLFKKVIIRENFWYCCHMVYTIFLFIWHFYFETF